MLVLAIILFCCAILFPVLYSVIERSIFNFGLYRLDKKVKQHQIKLIEIETRIKKHNAAIKAANKAINKKDNKC